MKVNRYNDNKKLKMKNSKYDSTNSKYVRQRIIAGILLILSICFIYYFIFYFEFPAREVTKISINKMDIKSEKLEVDFNSDQYDGKLVPLEFVLAYGEGVIESESEVDGKLSYIISIEGNENLEITENSRWVKINGDRIKLNAPVVSYEESISMGKIVGREDEISNIEKKKIVENILIPGELINEIFTGGKCNFKDGIASFSIDNTVNTGEKIQLKEDEGKLILVNNKNTLAEDFLPNNLADINDTSTVDAVGENTKLNKTVIKSLEDMKKDSPYGFVVTSAYRSYEAQKKVYDAQLKTYIKSGMNEDRAKNEVKKKVATPGESEHQTGLSMDLGKLGYANGYMFGKTEAGKWIIDNSYKYGLILRYTEEKTKDTGIIYEPWHYRYVGFPHSEVIKERSYILEEYYDYLNVVKYYTFESLNGNSYTVMYLSDSFTPKEIQYLDGEKVQVSDSNLNGVVITFVKK